MAKPTAAVIGAGLMGHGIASIFAAAGHRTFVHDAFPKTLETAPQRIAAVFELLGHDRKGLENLSYHASFEEAVKDADFVIEAAPEKPVAVASKKLPERENSGSGEKPLNFN